MVCSSRGSADDRDEEIIDGRDGTVRERSGSSRWFGGKSSR